MLLFFQITRKTLFCNIEFQMIILYSVLQPDSNNQDGPAYKFHLFMVRVFLHNNPKARCRSEIYTNLQSL